MRSAVYIPRGPWGGNVALSPSQIAQQRAAEQEPDAKPGDPWKPELVKILPNYPSGKPAKFPFWRPVILAKNDPELNGKPRPFMRAGSPIDMRPGVYFIFERKSKQMYIGSSIGESKQGNARRTAARHWQSWNRHKALSDYVSKFKNKGSQMKLDIPNYRYQGGVVMPREDVFICFMPIDNDDPRVISAYSGQGSNLYAPRQMEAWYFEHVCDHIRCAGVNQIAKVKRDEPDRQLEELSPVPF